MARAGSFGRRPRLNNSANQSSIATLLAQARAAEWSALQDAWKNGGDVVDPTDPEGKRMVKATDDVILAYMEKRRNAIADSTDPEAVQWTNNISQLKFSIAESKIGVQFKEGKVTAGAVSAFYKSQLSNYPVDSEIYRTIEKNAADWAKSANASASGGASAATTKALKARIDQDQAAAKSFLGINAAVDAYAQSKGWGKTALGTYDVAQLEQALSSGVIIDPSTGQAVSLASWKSAMQASYAAYGDAAAVYAQLGDASSAETYQGYQRTLSASYIRPSNTFDEREKYQVARDQWKNDLASAGNNPYAIDAANARYKDALGGILGDAQKAGLGETTGADPAFTGAITNELDTLNGGTGPDGKANGASWADITSGGGSSDLNETAAEVARVNEEKVKLANKTAYYGQATPLGEYKVNDMSTVQGATFAQDGTVILPDSYQRTTVTVGGQKMEVVMNGQPIYKTVLVDANGNALSATQIAAGGGAAKMLANGTAAVFKDPKATIIGYKFFDPAKGAGQPIQYGTYDSTGHLVFTTANPIVGTQTADGYVIVGGVGNVKGTQAQGTAIGYDPTAAPVTNVAAPGQTPTADMIQGSATLDPSRPAEQSFGVTQNNAAKFASMTGAKQLGLGTVPEPRTPSGIDLPGSGSPSQGWLTPSSGIDPALRGPVAETAYGIGSQIKSLTTPTITLPNLPGLTDQSRNPGRSPLAPGQGLGAPTPWISMPKPPGIVAPPMTDPSRNPFAPLPPLPSPPATQTPGALGKTSKAF